MGGMKLMQILVLLGMYFDAAVTFVINSLKIVFRFALAIMCTDTQAKVGNLASGVTDFFYAQEEPAPEELNPSLPLSKKNHQTDLWADAHLDLFR